MDIPNFFDQIQKIGWAQISQQRGNSGKSPKDANKRCTKLFINTINNPYDFILLGQGNLRSREEYKKYGLITDKTTGAILGINPWSTMLNDVFIYASVIARKSVKLILNNKSSDITISDLTIQLKKDQTILSTLGRELAQLIIFDYQIFESRDEYIIFSPPNRIIYLEFSDLWKRINQEHPKKIAEFIKKKEPSNL